MTKLENDELMKLDRTVDILIEQYIHEVWSILKSIDYFASSFKKDDYQSPSLIDCKSY